VNLLNIRALCLMCGLLTLNATAGSQQSQPARFEANQIIEFSKSVEKFAASKHARAFIIGRVGQPENKLPKGIRFTHTAIAVYSQIQLKSGELANGYAIYNLYQQADNPKRSDIVVDYPVDFFWGAQAMTAGVIIPSQQVQQALISAITQDVHIELHNPKYSVIANPNNNKYQNCTEHTLNVLNAAIYDSTDMSTIKQTIRQYFQPQTVHVSGFKLALGGLFSDDIRTSDHKGKPRTATFSTIAKYLSQYELLDGAYVMAQSGNVTQL